MSKIAPQRLPIVASLEKAFAHVNKGIFGGKLQIPPFVIQTEKKVILRFVSESFHIAIGTEFAVAKVQALHEALLHEMCHVYNDQLGIVDCTSNQYHNQKFLKVALNAGFWVVRHKTQGWGITSFDRPPVVSCWDCGEEYSSRRDACPECSAELQIEEPSVLILKRRIATFKSLELDQTVYQNAKRRIKSQTKGGTRKICFLKYQCQCPGPHNSFRTGRRPDGSNPIYARCEKCGALFECVEDEYLERKNNEGLVPA